MIETRESAAISRGGDTLVDETSVFAVHNISLMHRLDAIDSGSIPQRSFSVEEIAVILGTDVAWVQATVRLVGIDTGEFNTEDFDLPGYTLPVLGAEKAWQDSYNAMPEFIPKTDAATILGTSPRIVSRLASRLGYEPEENDINAAVTAHSYTKTTMLELRARIMEIVPTSSSVTLEHLMDVTGMGRTWVVNHLDDAGYAAEDRWSDESKRVCKHYPEDAEDYITELRRSLPNRAPEGWVAARQVRDRLGRGETWVNARLQKHTFHAVELLDAVNRVQTFYPPFVFDELYAMSEADRALLPLGENFTIPEVIESTGYLRATLLTVLTALSIQPEKRRATDDRVFDTLSPEQVEMVAKFDMQQYVLNSLKRSIKEFGEGHVDASIEIDSLRADLMSQGGESKDDRAKRLQLEKDLAAAKAVARSFARRRLSAMRRLEELESETRVA